MAQVRKLAVLTLTLTLTLTQVRKLAVLGEAQRTLAQHPSALMYRSVRPAAGGHAGEGLGGHTGEPPPLPLVSRCAASCRAA